MGFGVRVVDVLAGAYRSVEQDWCTWLKLILAPLLALLIVNFLVSLGAEMVDMNFLLAYALNFLVGLFFGSMLWVNIYRYGILGEYKDTWLSLRVDRPVWKVILYTLLIYVAIAVAVAFVGAVHMAFNNMDITIGIGTIVGILVLYLLFRLFLLLIPGVAAGVEQPIRTIFRMTKRQVLFIFFAMLTLLTTYISIFVVAAVPFGVAAGVLSVTFLVHEGLAQGLMAGIGFIYGAVCYFYIIAVSAKAVSNVYLDCNKSK